MVLSAHVLCNLFFFSLFLHEMTICITSNLKYVWCPLLLLVMAGNQGQAVDVNELLDEANEVPTVGNGAAQRLNWTAAMSGFILGRFSDLVAEGVRTDKGFKDIHTNSVAARLSEFIGQHVTGTQVYNHLRKWRNKWVKICRLKELSGANWDEDLCMITLDPEHYNGHVKVRFGSLFHLLCCMILVLLSLLLCLQGRLTSISMCHFCRITPKMQSTSMCQLSTTLRCRQSLVVGLLLGDLPWV